MDISKTSNKEITKILIEIGMKPNIIDELFKIFKKKVSPRPQGYPNTAEITKLLVASSFTLSSFKGDITDQAKMLVLGRLASEQAPIPWYWLDRELGEDLAMTDKPTAISQDIILPDRGIIVLPSDLVETSTGKISFIAYALFRAGQEAQTELYYADIERRQKAAFAPSRAKPDNNNIRRQSTRTKFTGETGHRLCWCAIENSYVYGGIAGLIPEDGCFKIDVSKSNYIENSKIDFSC